MAEFFCTQCKAPLFKSYGNTHKMRSRNIRWEGMHDTATVQCNMCRSFNELPIKLKIGNENLTFEITTPVKKSEPKDKLIITHPKKKK